MDENQDVIGAVARLFRMMRRRPLKHEELPHMSYRILWVLRHNDGIRASELVGQLEMRPASVTDALNRLERQGYLTRERDESDARAKRVFLTERARAEMDAQEKSRREENERLLKCLTEEEARGQNQPILKVSGGGGFTITGAVSELLKDQLTIGQEVTVNDWNSGMSYVGTITSVGDFPTSNNFYSGVGNTNVSYYPFTVFVDESADLREGNYVNMTFSTAGAQNGIYLQNPFIRTEKGRSYVLVMGQDGRLEQRYVTTGKALWGSYTEILSGLTAEDRVAFPYGKNVKPGAPAVDGDISDLYR